MNPGDFLRRELAQNAGLFLDEPAAQSPTATSSPTTSPATVDRELVREILVDRGAPAEAIDWLVDSCTSVEAAREFVPTPWMRRSIGDTEPAFDPGELVGLVIGTQVIEAFFHRMLRRSRIRGEWYRLSDDDVAYAHSRLWEEGLSWL